MTSWFVRIRQWLLAALVAYWVLLFTGTHLPRIGKVGVSDKTLHFAAFYGLGFLLAMTCTAYRRLDRWHYGWLLLALTIYAAFDEVLQIPVGRHADPYDWLADSIGAAAGLSTFAILREVRRYWIRQHNSVNP